MKTQFLSEKSLNTLTPKSALYFIVLFGIVSLFADMTYEGARSITGAYLGLLGASAVTVGFVAGAGELIGYGLRLFSGMLADKTGRYWTMTVTGYLINLLVVPALALTNNWIIASMLIVMERFGKAIRTPSRNAMLSYAGQTVGMGWAFGLHKALDQIGGMLGPIIISAVLFFKLGFSEGFAVLGIPAFLALVMLMITRWIFPNPKNLILEHENIKPQGMASLFWWYIAAISLIGAGYADFSLMAYHFEKTKILSALWIPLAYAAAMGSSSLFTPILGHLYDRLGMIVLITVIIITVFFAPLVFLSHTPAIVISGVVLWAIGVSAQDSLMSAFIGNLVAPEKRASAFGVFNMAYGIFWFLGSFIMGFIYEHSLRELVIFIMALQFLSLPLLIIVKYKLDNLEARD